MEGIIADTSIWIDFFAQIENPKVDEMRRGLLTNHLFICPVIIQEVLQGIKHDKIHKSCQDALSAIPMLSANMWDASTGAAAIYRKLRKLGTTIRKPNDCLIAWYAISFDLTLIHNDKDFENMAPHIPLKFL